MIEAIRQCLAETVYPNSTIPFSRFSRIDTQDGSPLIQVDLGVPAHKENVKSGKLTDCKSILSEALKQRDLEANIAIRQAIPSIQPSNNKGRINGVKNIIAVASGKGGVGKSTTAVNLALALSKMGATVGILDADIYGPSQPHMLGVANERPEVMNNNTILPIQVYGLQLVSMGNLVTENTPMVWRGPMASGALKQLLEQTRWQEVDYLIVDMPPGTGDIQLTLSQSVPVSGSVIVTTPQDIALIDAKKGIEMFRKVNIPVYGVVENMSTHTCSSCGHEEAIFGTHGGDSLAEQYQTALLGRLPLALDIREMADSGCPTIEKSPESSIASTYFSMAEHLAVVVWEQSLSEQTVPVFSVEDD